MTFDELITGIRQSEPAITHVDFSQISDFQNEHGQYMPPDFSRASSHYNQYCELIDVLRFSPYVTKLSFTSVVFDFGRIATKLDGRPAGLSLLIDLLIDNPTITSLNLSESLLMDVDQLFQSLSDTAIQILDINKIITGQQHKEIVESIAKVLETNTTLRGVHCAALDSTLPEEASPQLDRKVALLLHRNNFFATLNLAENIKFGYANLVHQMLALPQIIITKKTEVDLHLGRQKPSDRTLETDSFEPTSSHASDTTKQSPLPSTAAEPVLYPVNRSASLTSAEQQPRSAKRTRRSRIDKSSDATRAISSELYAAPGVSIGTSSAKRARIDNTMPSAPPTISELYAEPRTRVDKTLPSVDVDGLPTLPELFAESEVDIETRPYPVGRIDNKYGFFCFSPPIPSTDPNDLDIQPKY